MMKLQTPVEQTPCSVEISYGDRILLLGSCFSDSIGKSLADYGFEVLANPFGTLYNPASIYSAMLRLHRGRDFGPEDCVPMGAGAGRICSFSHHTSFAREDREAFLKNANEALHRACEFFEDCSKVIITLGTAWCFKYIGATEIDPSNVGKIVSNCLKRDAREFSRERLSALSCAAYLDEIIDLCRGKDIIFTVSPIRHMADGAHGNQLSKSTLLLAVDKAIASNAAGRRSDDTEPASEAMDASLVRRPVCDYFPAYEIMMDELRDYRFWAEDMVHPSAQATAYITKRFLSRHLAPDDRPRLEESIRAWRQSQHRPIL